MLIGWDVTCDRCGDPADSFYGEGNHGLVEVNGHDVPVDLCINCMRQCDVETCVECNHWVPLSELQQTDAYECHRCSALVQEATNE